MAPNMVGSGDAAPTQTTVIEEKIPPKMEPYKRVIVWRNVAIFVYVHLAAVYGMYLMLASARIFTTLWAIFLYHISGLGITAGAHRLWAHKSYKAKLPLKILLTLFNTVAFQNDVYEWARDHRLHHKYSETDADPHNATRGFFFSHIGWLLVRKHPQVREKGQGLDMSDLKADPILRFQKKHYNWLMPLCAFVLPTVVPVYFWGETWSNAWFVAGMWRFCWVLNMTWLVNSAAHMWGNKPYDKNINPAENVMVAWGALGEGWHNYHHVFPWDYKTAELGKYVGNFTTLFIDCMAAIGWAYDLKTVSDEVVVARAMRTGDGSHTHSHEGSLWGWGDKDITSEQIQQTTILKGSKGN